MDTGKKTKQETQTEQNTDYLGGQWNQAGAAYILKMHKAGYSVLNSVGYGPIYPLFGKDGDDNAPN